MTIRLALRSLLARPVRSAVLSCGFGFGVAVMAALLGVGDVILEQSRAPALWGGGDLLVSSASGRLPSARFVVGSVLANAPFAGRVAAVSPSASGTLYLVEPGRVTSVRARAGIPSLERAIGDPEIAQVSSWTDPPSASRWTHPDPADVLRSIDRFHPIPEAKDWEQSWAEWLYFNGRTTDGLARFYLTFLVGPRTSPNRRAASVRLQLERNGVVRNYSRWEEVSESEVLASAPDLLIAGSRVRLEGLDYQIALRLDREAADPASLRARARAKIVAPSSARAQAETAAHRLEVREEEASGSTRATDAMAASARIDARAEVADLAGDLVLRAAPGRSVPPIVLRGARDWLSGYAVPVLEGALHGALRDERADVVVFEKATGYHDHNWGFWEGVTWQWGQVAHDDLSIVYGRVKPPASAADPERIPGFLAVLAPEGPLGFTSRVTIVETGDGPSTVTVEATEPGFEVRLDAAVRNVVRSPLGGPFGDRKTAAAAFLQMRADFKVRGTVHGRSFDFEAPGSAETFRAW